MQPNNTNTLATEIILGVVAGLMALAAPVLLYLGTINFSGALAVWGIAAGVVGVKLALNAPSPAQQAQISTLQAQQNTQAANLQQLLQYALSVLPGLVQNLQAPVASPQAQQTLEHAQPVTPAPVANPAPVASQASFSSGNVAQSPAQQFKPPVPVAQLVMEHPPILEKDTVTTFPEIPIVGQQAQKQAQQ